MGSYDPQPALRQNLQVHDAKEVACLFVDVQNYNCHPEGALSKALPEQQLNSVQSAVNACCPKWKQLQETCWSLGIEVMYCVIQSLTKDGRDRSLDYKISGFMVPPGSWDSQVLDVIRPDEDEIVLSKGSCSVFQSTNLDYLLRCMEKRVLIVCGCLTDKCVSHAVRDACDLGYHVVVLTGHVHSLRMPPEMIMDSIDCCVAMDEEMHQSGLQSMKGFCRQMTLDAWIVEAEQWPLAKKRDGEVLHHGA